AAPTSAQVRVVVHAEKDIKSYVPLGDGAKKASHAVPPSKLLAHEAAAHLLISALHVAQVATETVLIQLLAGLGVPEAAGVGADLVGQDDGAVEGLAELQLEVHQGHAALGQSLLQELI